MKVTLKPHGKGNFLTVTNDCGLEVTLSQIGAGVYSVFYKGEAMNAGPMNKDAYITDRVSFYGKTIAPFAGRLKDGLFSIGEKGFHLPLTETGLSLHSGTLNAAFRLFDCEIRNGKEGMDVVFSLMLEATDEFPATIPFRVRYFIYEKRPRFDVYFEARPEQDTLWNPTTHLYWNLGGKKDVLHHTLALHSHEFEVYDDSLLPIKRQKVDAVMDFNKAKEVGKDLFAEELKNSKAKGYDHAFYLDQGAFPSAVLESKEFGMRVETDAPALQIYTDNYPQKGKRLLNNDTEIRHSAITFEPVGDLLDPSSLIAKKGEGVSRMISYTFYQKKGC